MVILFLVLTPSHFTHSSAMDERRVRPFDPGEMAIDPIPTYDYHYHHRRAGLSRSGCPKGRWWGNFLAVARRRSGYLAVEFRLHGYSTLY